jgi:hypothetical protein
MFQVDIVLPDSKDIMNLIFTYGYGIKSILELCTLDHG